MFLMGKRSCLASSGLPPFSKGAFWGAATADDETRGPSKLTLDFERCACDTLIQPFRSAELSFQH